ncbi:MAG: outer membrane protein transport protein [Candidatus Poribacteria bacterium]|nr:outer membrane protein transport protein [Candidatus Poribacteria bacterium]
MTLKTATKHPRHVGMILLVFLFQLVGVAFSQVEEKTLGNHFGVGASAMGMGGAFIGTANDFTALYWNPAGIAQIKKAELFSALSHTALQTTTQFSGAEATDSDQSKTRLGSMGLVFPVTAYRGGFAFGFGFNRVQGFDSRTQLRGFDPSTDPDFGGFFVDEINSDSGGINVWSFGGAAYISRHISLGASLDFWSGSQTAELDVIATDRQNVDGEVAEFSFFDTIDRNVFGLGGKLGALFQLSRHVSAGVTVTLPMSLEVDEDWTQGTSVRFDDGSDETDVESGSTLFDIKRPFEFGGGIAIRLLNQRLLFAGDVQYVDWTQAEYSDSPADDTASNDFQNFYTDTLRLHIGMEYFVPGVNIPIRIGYLHDPLPYVGKVIEDNRDFLTVGTGVIINQVIKVDVAYLRGLWEQSDPSLNEKRDLNRLFVSAAYRY